MRRVGDGEGNVVTSADAGCFMDLIYRVATSRGEIGSILLFSFIGWSFFFYGASMWDREEQETARRFEIG